MEITEQEISERTAKAEELFRQGYNCSQSVVGAWADRFGIDFNLAVRLSASFGGGIGRMRETCGAACGMFILAGADCGSTDPKDIAGKGANYKVVQSLARCFREKNGYLKCGELLSVANVRSKEKNITSPEPQERTAEYYKRRPCVEMVKSGAEIFGRYLADRQSFCNNTGNSINNYSK